MSKFPSFPSRLPAKLLACEIGPNYIPKDALGWWLNSANTEKHCQEYLSLGHAHWWVDSGRTGLTLLLSALNLPGERVLLQGYSCVVVPNAVRAAGMRPVVIDIEPNGFNLDLDVVEQQARTGVRVVVVQHTYGIAVDMERLSRLRVKYDLLLIEDMAHALGNRFNGRLLGTFGFGAVYSFGRDKVVSSGTGGLVVINQDTPEVRAKLENSWQKLPRMSRKRVFAQIYYLIVVTLLVRPFYHWQAGKVILLLSQKCGLIDPVFTRAERVGSAQTHRASQYSFFLKKILTGQFKRLSKTQAHRLGLVSRYNAAFGTDYTYPLLRYPLVTTQSEKIARKLRRQGAIVGTWYQKVFIPSDEAVWSLGIAKQDLPEIRKTVFRKVLNLPTHANIRGQDAQKIITTIIDNK